MNVLNNPFQHIRYPTKLLNDGSIIVNDFAQKDNFL